MVVPGAKSLSAFPRRPSLDSLQAPPTRPMSGSAVHRPTESLLRSRSATSKGLQHSSTTPAASTLPESRPWSQEGAVEAWATRLLAQKQARGDNRPKTAMSSIAPVDLQARSHMPLAGTLQDGGQTKSAEQAQGSPLVRDDVPVQGPVDRVLRVEMHAAPAGAEVPTKPPTIGSPPSSRACLLARMYRLELYEVKHILRCFDGARSHSSAGGKPVGAVVPEGGLAAAAPAARSEGLDGAAGLSPNEFRTALCRVFDVPELDQTVVDGAYAASGMQEKVDVTKFLSWYVQNMFSKVVHLTASPENSASDSLVYWVARRHGVCPVTVDKIKKEFDRYDMDRSGSIDYDEFEAMLREVLHVKTANDLGEIRVTRFWKEIDKDASGEVDFHEFAEWYLKYFNPESEAGDQSSGPIEAFYKSYNPGIQWERSFNRRNFDPVSIGPPPRAARVARVPSCPALQPSYPGSPSSPGSSNSPSRRRIRRNAIRQGSCSRLHALRGTSQRGAFCTAV